jgi:predicted transcriptional regulator of viral defense system
VVLTRRAMEAAIAALAARQYGVVARWQLLELGLTSRAISYRLTVGRLHLVHRGVYAVGHKRISGRGRWMAAVLACGPGSALSHRSGAALWGFLGAASPRIDVTTPRRGGRSIAGVRRHRARRLPPEDTTMVDGIPVTTVARTLFDLAEVLDLSRLERAFEAAERAELLDMRAVLLTAERNPGRRAHKQTACAPTQPHIARTDTLRARAALQPSVSSRRPPAPAGERAGEELRGGRVLASPTVDRRGR